MRTDAIGNPIQPHAVPLVAAAQEAARGAGPMQWQVACVVEWASILVHSLQHGDRMGAQSALRTLAQLFGTAKTEAEAVTP